MSAMESYLRGLVHPPLSFGVGNRRAVYGVIPTFSTPSP
jgi:hypothetical protein